VTCVDTKILIATAIGSSLTRVLFFGKTVLSVDWWKKYIFANSENGRRRQEQEQQKSEDANMIFGSNHNITESKSQSLVQVKKLSKWNENYDLINKKVISCENGRYWIC
jgi:regulator of sirC expression with transglutaminase-like and TPR domain